jgi:hypothetical protein
MDGPGPWKYGEEFITQSYVNRQETRRPNLDCDPRAGDVSGKIIIGGHIANRETVYPAARPLT